MKKKKKGFTLIELLAIIVILAIIAVITVPIILNIIENSKRGAVIDSAYGYKDSINKYYVTELAKDPEFALSNGVYTVNNDGSITSGDNTYTIPFSGTKPSGGNVTIDDSVVTSACLVIDDYKVELKEGKFTTDGKGNCTNSGGGLVGDQPQTYKKYEDGTEIYFNVDSGKGCTEEEYNDNKEKASENPLKSGCMKFFAFLDDENSNTVNLLLDHNTTSEVAWENSQRNSSTNYTGPGIDSDEVLYQLKEDTKDWSNELETPKSYTAKWDYESQEQTYTLNYDGYKARLITAEEMAQITSQEGWTLSSTDFYFDSDCKELSMCSSGENEYWWLFENTGDRSEFTCEIYGCQHGSSGPYGYWMSSPDTGRFNYAWGVNFDGRLYSNQVGGYFINYGLRPVITVSKSKLSNS